MKNTKSSWKSWAAIVAGFVAVTLGGFRSTAWSEDVAPPDRATLEERVNDLDQTVKTLEKLYQGQQESTANAPQISAGPEGFALKSPEGNFVLKLRGLIQADGRFYGGQAAATQTDTFLLRRVRPILEGTLFRFYDFLIVPDFGGGTTALYDAYLDIRPWTFAKLRVGKFKPPLGLERLQSDSTLVFAERGLTSNLIPQRDIGAQFFGEAAKGAITYQAAFTNGAADSALLDTDTNDAKEGSLRVFTQPFKTSTQEALKGLGVGLAGSYSGDNTSLATYKTASGQSTFFSYGTSTLGDGQRIHWVPQANYYWRSLGVFGEYAQSSQVARLGTVKTRLTNQAWQGAASYVVTGEKASAQGVVPDHPFDPQSGTWGAWELAARFHQLTIDPDTFDLGFASRAASARKATGYTLGVNWYLNKAVKWTTDVEQTWFKGGGGTSTADRLTEHVVLTRLQLAF